MLLFTDFFVSFNVYLRILLSKSSFKRLIFTLLEQLNTNLQGISIPPHSCLQWRLRPVTFTHIFPPRAMKYHKIREYSRGKWPTISLFLITFTANLSTSLSSSWSAWSFSPIAIEKETEVIASMRVLFCVLCMMMTRPCPRLLPTFKAWLLSTCLFCFNGTGLYGVFRSDNLEKSGQKSILSWRCHKFNRKRR